MQNKTKFLTKLTAFLLMLVVLTGTFALYGCNEPAPDPTPDPDPTPTPEVDPISDNYRTFYQIFVGSFADANDDGFGDLRGIIKNFDYLNDGDIHSGNDLGVQGIWLSPIFTSPSYHKYDAKDYYKIDWRFGTDSDLIELAQLCEARNVKLILDLAINHTSSSHEWFLQFKDARMKGDTENPYYDFYTCVTTAEKQNGVTYQKIAGVDAWFECNFSSDMPELNFDNPTVRKEMLAVAKHYLDMGIDGFRFDAVKYIYYGDTERSVAFWEWYMDELRAYAPDIYCVGECWSGETEIIDYYSAMNCFNFAMSQAEGKAATAAKGNSNIGSFLNYVVAYQNKIKDKNPDSMAMSFLSNHDMDRIASAFVTENVMRMAANLYLLSPGSPVIYYGEELGMRGSRGSANTDANRRLAMLWGNEYQAKDPVGTTYSSDKQIQSTVVSQLEDSSSLLNYYVKLIAIRHKYEGIARGEYTVLSTSQKNVGGFIIRYEGETILLIHNTSTQAITVDLAKCSALTGMTIGELLDSIGAGGQSTLDGTQLTIAGQSSVIIG